MISDNLHLGCRFEIKFKEIGLQWFLQAAYQNRLLFEMRVARSIRLQMADWSDLPPLPDEELEIIIYKIGHRVLKKIQQVQ
jgi:hypothetical protein